MLAGALVLLAAWIATFVLSDSFVGYQGLEERLWALVAQVWALLCATVLILEATLDQAPCGHTKLPCGVTRQPSLPLSASIRRSPRGRPPPGEPVAPREYTESLGDFGSQQDRAHLVGLRRRRHASGVTGTRPHDRPGEVDVAPLSAISAPLLARPVSTAVKEDRGIPTAELRDL